MAGKKRILVLLEGGDAYSSGVVRGLIYRDWFARSGHEATFVNRQHPALVRLYARLEQDGSPRYRLLRLVGARRVISAVTRFRSWRLLSSLGRSPDRHDVIYMSKVLDHDFVKALRTRTRARLVLDFGDAVWNYPSVTRFGDTLRLVDAVTTDCPITRDYSLRFNPRAVVIPDCPQVEAFDARRGEAEKAGEGKPVTIGWIGSPSTAHNLGIVHDALEIVFSRHPDLRLRLVGTGHDPAVLPRFSRVRYSTVPGYDQSRMIEEVLAMDIGLFPLDDSEASVVRGVLKATIYMSGEAVVVASPVGQSTELIQDGVNGMLAGTTAEWVEKLERLVGDAGLRARIARAALEQVRKDFSVESSFRKLEAVLAAEPRAQGAIKE
jgi:glycosyltransferase involved in cell wall biosynthesis